MQLFIKAGEEYDDHFVPVILKMGNLSDVVFTGEKIEGAASFIIKTVEYYIPLGSRLDVESELKKTREELEYTRGFLKSVMNKLDNERFVGNAPASVIESERKKKSDAETKIKSLEDRESELMKLRQ
jgi:valyl-tRNA synthetase